jgi:hypothetical protein
MANEFMQAAKMAYGFSGTTQKILWFLCDEISANSREKYLRSRVGFVVRSYDLIAFRCACNRWSITQAIKILTEARVLKAIKKGPRKYFLFCIYLDRLIALRREWADEKRVLEIRKSFANLPEADPMDIAEEEMMWAAEAQEEERMELASWSPSRANSELENDIGSANVESAGDADKPVQRLAQPMSTVAKPMSSAGKPMSSGREANVKKSRKVAETIDSDALPESTENAYGGSLSGVMSRFVQSTNLTVPEGPSVVSHVRSTQIQNPQTSGTSSPNPRDREIHSPSPQGAKRPFPKIAPPPSAKAKKPEENLCAHGVSAFCQECDAQRRARIKQAAEERDRRCKHGNYARKCHRCKIIAAGDVCEAHERFTPCKDCDPQGYEDLQEGPLVKPQRGRLALDGKKLG